MGKVLAALHDSASTEAVTSDTDTKLILEECTIVMKTAPSDS